jgi:hypothetical protein
MGTQQSFLVHPTVEFKRVGVYDFDPNTKLVQLQLSRGCVLQHNASFGEHLVPTGFVLWLPMDAQEFAQFSTMAGHYGIEIETLLLDEQLAQAAVLVRHEVDPDVPF